MPITMQDLCIVLSDPEAGLCQGIADVGAKVTLFETMLQETSLMTNKKT